MTGMAGATSVTSASFGDPSLGKLGEASASGITSARIGAHETGVLLSMASEMGKSECGMRALSLREVDDATFPGAAAGGPR